MKKLKVGDTVITDRIMVIPDGVAMKVKRITPDGDVIMMNKHRLTSNGMRIRVKITMDIEDLESL